MRVFSCPILVGCLLSVAAAQAPVVAALTPAAGSTDVAPGACELRIVFDRAMDTAAGYSFGTPTDGATFPKATGKPVWVDAKTLTMAVQLDAGVQYGCDLNGVGTKQAFRDAQGRVLAPTRWRFATKGGGACSEPLADQPSWNERATAAMEQAILERYSYRDRTGTKWRDVFAAQRADLAAAATRAQWVERAAKVLAAAQDPHLWFELDGKVVGTRSIDAPANVNVRLLPKLLPGIEQVNPNVLKARTDDGIGYVLVATLDRKRASDVEQVQQVLASLRDCKALVLDLRPNGGGDERLARAIAAWFVDGDTVYAAHRVVDANAEGGFGPVQQRTIRGNDDPSQRFAGKVAVLMGPRNLSSCEALLLMLRQAPRATLIGARSSGSSGNPQPVAVGDGVTLMVPSWQALRPDGTSFEGEGIAPDVAVEATAEQLRREDPVLERALAVLRGT